MKTKIPNKKKRMIIYKKMLNYFNNNTDYTGFCRVLMEIGYKSLDLDNCDRDIFNKAFEERVYDFPELLKYKPKDAKKDEFWFSMFDRQIRIDILNRILTK